MPTTTLSSTVRQPAAPPAYPYSLVTTDNVVNRANGDCSAVFGPRNGPVSVAPCGGAVPAIAAESAPESPAG
jgi:hypothetical protein